MSRMDYNKAMKSNIDTQLAFKRIDLRGRNVWDDDLLYMADKRVQEITQVLLWNNNVTWKGILSISSCNWGSLAIIELDGNHIGNKGARYLARLKAPILNELNCCSNDIGKEGMLHISKGNWPKLTVIWLNGNKLGLDSMKNLNKNAWKAVKSIHTYNCRINILEARQLALSHWSLLTIDIEKNMSVNELTQLKNTLNRKFWFRL